MEKVSWGLSAWRERAGVIETGGRELGFINLDGDSNGFSDWRERAGVYQTGGRKLGFSDRREKA